MKYFDTKKDSLEEAISKAINEKPEQLKEEVIKEAFSKDIQDFISTGGIMSKVIKQARDVTPKELKDKKFLQKILKYWKSTSIDATNSYIPTTPGPRQRQDGILFHELHIYML